MAESLAEDAWSREFQTAAPRPLLALLQRRLAASTSHVHALSELFRERAAIENEYAAKLAKLARSAESGLLLGKNGVEWDKHGGEAKLWDAVVADIHETSSAHSTLSTMLKDDFAQPIRNLPTKVVPWRRVIEQEANLDRALKDQEKIASKLDKAMHKSKSAKTDQLSGELDQANTTVTTLTPMVYTTFQHLDEERLRALKEVIVRWSTARADIASRGGERAEASVASLLSWEPEDEVLAVGHRLAGQAGDGPAARNGSISGGALGNAPAVVAPAPVAPTRRMSATTDFAPRNKANGSTGPSSGGTGGFSGFKSMLSRKATVAGRQRSGSEATSTRSARRPTGDLMEDNGSIHERPASREQRPKHDREASSQRIPPVDEEGYSMPPPDRHRNPWEDPNELIPTPAHNADTSQAKAGVALPSALFAEQRVSSSPSNIADSSSTHTSISDVSAPRLNLSLASAPIQETEEERQAALAKMQEALQMAPQPPARRSTLARGRRDGRHTMQATVDSTPLPANHMAALAKLGETEQLQDEGQLPRQDVVRQRSVSSLSSRNPFESPSLQTTGAVGTSAGHVSGSMNAAAPILASANDAPVESPTNSITGWPASPSVVGPSRRSTMSLPISSTGMAATGPGLRASIVETVHTFLRQGQSQRTVVSGEIHLAFIPPAGHSPSTGPLHIRLTNFDALESISPNPAFLGQVPERPGEYYLNTEMLADATTKDGSKGSGQRLFKYHVLVPAETESAMIPLTFSPAFQVKSGETRMILHYRVNAGSGLSDFNLAVTFPGQPEVTNTQSKPVQGVWSAAGDAGADKRVSWKLAAQEGADGKIIARFVTAAGAPQLAPSAVDAQFILPNRLLSGIGIETADGSGELAFTNVAHQTVSGKYMGEASVNP